MNEVENSTYLLKPYLTMSAQNETRGAVLNLGELKTADFKRIIVLLQREIVAKNERLRGVEELTRICAELEEKRKSWQVRAENYEIALQRAEARIGYLNKKLGVGPQTAFNMGVINPGVSRKDFEEVSRENVKLKDALEHIVATNLGGQHVVLKNKELYELVTTLQEDILQRDHHIKELEASLANSGNNLGMKVNELTKEKASLERSMKAKQVFSEKLLKENKELKVKLENAQAINELQDLNQDNTDGQVDETNGRQRNDAVEEELEALKRAVEEKQKKIEEQEAVRQELIEKADALSTRVTALLAELEKEKERKTKLEAELTETAKKCADFQKKCAGFFKQVVSLNGKQQQSEEEIAALKRSNENLKADVAERRAMITMMTDSLKTYEDDFRRENEEKANIKKKFEEAQQEVQRYKRENQSHTATIRHFEGEIERMSKLLVDERNRQKNTGNGFQSAFGNAFGSTASRSIFQDRHPSQIVVADGGGVNESDSNQTRNQLSMPNPKPDPPRSSPSLIECPYCSRSYPYHLIEGHVQDCMEDSLYLDD